MSAQTVPQQIQNLANELEREFAAKVEVEPAATTDRFRIAVVSDQFENMPQLARQDRVWEIVDRVIARQDSLLISMVLAFAPSELDADNQ